MLTDPRRLARFLSGIRVGSPDGCWPWTRALMKAGYGEIRMAGRTLYTHRLSYEHHVGPIPKGLFVCHRCDNRRCCNPAHLFLGTSLDNVRDMVAKGRGYRPEPKGAEHGRAKLTDADVLEIRRRRKAGESRISVAAAFGIHKNTVSGLTNGRAWRHLA